MSWVKSTKKIYEKSATRAQTEALLKQASTHLYNQDIMTINVTSWNSDGREIITFDKPWTTKVGNVYSFPSGTDLTVEIRGGDTLKPFMFWHGFDQNKRRLSFKLTKSFNLTAVYSGAYFSGDGCVEDFENFISGQNLFNLATNSLGYFVNPKSFSSIFQFTVDFESLASGTIFSLPLTYEDSKTIYKTSRYAFYESNYKVYTSTPSIGIDSFEQYGSGQDVYFLSGADYYFYTGKVLNFYTPSLLETFEPYATGNRDKFELTYYNFVKYEVTGQFNTGQGTRTSKVIPGMLVVSNLFEVYPQGTIDYITGNFRNYEGNIINYLPMKPEPFMLVGFDLFSSYPTGSITGLSGFSVNYLYLTNCTGKILPSGG